MKLYLTEQDFMRFSFGGGGGGEGVGTDFASKMGKWVKYEPKIGFLEYI